MRRIELQLGVAPSHYEPGQPIDGGAQPGPGAAAGPGEAGNGSGEAQGQPREQAVRL